MDKKVDKKNANNNKETNLAYGGQALIEGVLMRGQEGYAFTVKQPDDKYYKEKTDYQSLGKRIKLFGLPFIRGIIGLFENMYLGSKILNKSAEIAFPDEVKSSEKFSAKIGSFFAFALAIVIAVGIFMILPRYLPSLLTKFFHNFTPEKSPFLYNLINGILRLLFFFIYLALISIMQDVKRLFGYHGAEHKTIHTYEHDKPLIVENVKKSSRLHPRCGTSFIFLVFLITIFVFPFFDIFFKNVGWYNQLASMDKLGKILQNTIIILLHIIVGMPIVASISYEILKLTAKFQKNILVKLIIAPGLFFQLFTTRNPDSTMIKAGIYSLKMVLNEEEVSESRIVSDNIIAKKRNLVTNILLLPIIVILLL